MFIIDSAGDITWLTGFRPAVYALLAIALSVHMLRFLLAIRRKEKANYGFTLGNLLGQR